MHRLWPHKRGHHLTTAGAGLIRGSHREDGPVRSFLNTWLGLLVCTGSLGGCNPTKELYSTKSLIPRGVPNLHPASGWTFCICYFYNISEVALCCSYQWKIKGWLSPLSLVISPCFVILTLLEIRKINNMIPKPKE